VPARTTAFFYRAPPTRGAHQTHLLRDILDSPFGLVALHRARPTPNLTALAGVIYEDRAFDRMQILADALEEAGCDNADILSHCRGPRPRVPRCCVVDLLLGKMRPAALRCWNVAVGACRFAVLGGHST
jgi:hypothetical protein